MLFAVHCRDAAGVDQAREIHLSAHKDYLKGQAGMLVLGGALLGEDARPVGSLYIVNAEDAAAARRFVDMDPFARHGVFAEISVSAMRKSHWHPEVAG